MLIQLRIQNLAVVEDVLLTFDDGLNVLTGSTGAGKSLILGAVNILLGERTGIGTIRAGRDQAIVEGRFRVGRPVEGTTVPTGSELTLRREIHRTGRSHAFIDGKSCSVKQLRDISGRLIEPHGQNEQLQLKDPQNHIAYVDRVAGNRPLVDEYRAVLVDYQAAANDLATFDRRVALLKERQELLVHRIEELDGAELVLGEKGDLERSINVLENAEEIFAVLNQAAAMIYDDENSVVSMIGQSRRGLGRIEEFDERLGRFAKQLEEADIQLSECASEMRSFLDRLEFDPGELTRLRERFDFLLALERRYKKPIEELIEARDSWRREIDSLTFEEDERKRLRTRKEEALTRVRTAALELADSRRKAAGRLDESMTGEIERLMMRGATFRTNLVYSRDQEGELVIQGQRVGLGPAGIDEGMFFIRTNPGEAEGPLSEIASSGELSRIALALKEVMSEGREGTVLIFDELDAGIGADMGELIARKLDHLARRYQIICITHMPQIAARANAHFVVSKSTRRGRAFTRVESVISAERVKEIARMLGGGEDSKKRVALAEEMLKIGKGKVTSRVRP